MGFALVRRTAEYPCSSPAHHLAPDRVNAVHACWYLLVHAFSLQGELLVVHALVHLLAAVSQLPPARTAYMHAVIQALA